MLKISVINDLAEILNSINEEYSIVTHAKDYARKVHAGQQRRSDKSPYFTHVLRVSKMAASLGYSEDIQIAAVLHDAVEDGANPKEIAGKILEKFGKRVLDIVLNLTHAKEMDYIEYIVELALKDADALKVKLLDMYDNLTTSPSAKQKLKYQRAVERLQSEGVNIPEKILAQFK